MKVVYNTCYGGFGLSEEAMRLYANKVNGELVESESYGRLKFFHIKVNEEEIYSDDIKRHDPILVEVVEELGSERASGFCAKLAIREISGNTYLIDDYDGKETVETPYDDRDWITA